MNKTIVNVYRGTCGMGVTVSITYDQTRVIFDFGAPFTPLSNVYDGEVRRRQENSIKDALLLKRALMIPGIYNRKDLKDLTLLPYEESDLHTVFFISHLHLDHMSEIDKIAKEIDVYLHKDGIKLLNVLNENAETKTYRECIGFDYKEKIRIGEIEIEPLFSDHPCPGASMFLITTPDTKICYSGDIRFHGCRYNRAFEEVKQLRKEKIDLLLLDATIVSPLHLHLDKKVDASLFEPSRELKEGCISEEEIYAEIAEILKDKEALCVFNQYERDTQMMRHMIEVGEKEERMTVFDPLFAKIIKEVEGLKVPVYLCEKDPISPSLKDHLIITKEMIKNNPGHYLLQNHFSNLLQLTDFDGLKAHYFHLFGEPLVEGTKEYRIMLNVIEKLGWTFYSRSNLYSFSHAYPNQLAYMIKTIEPKTIIALHSKHPENLHPPVGEQFYPEEGRDYVVEKGRLIKKEKYEAGL